METIASVLFRKMLKSEPTRPPMSVQDICIYNDFDRVLFVVYNDRHHRFIAIPPEKEESLSVLIRGKIAEVSLFTCFLFDSQSETSINIPFEDVILRNRSTCSK